MHGFARAQEFIRSHFQPTLFSNTFWRGHRHLKSPFNREASLPMRLCSQILPVLTLLITACSSTDSQEPGSEQRPFGEESSAEAPPAEAATEVTLVDVAAVEAVPRPCHLPLSVWYAAIPSVRISTYHSLTLLPPISAVACRDQP